MKRDDIMKRFEEIAAQEPEAMTEAEAASLAAAEAMDDGSSVTLEELKEELEAYSGKIVIRIPKSLHKDLRRKAAVEGVSLNQYMLYKLAR